MNARTYATENLRACFGDLVDDARVTEIIVNADGSIWVERAGDAAMHSLEQTLDAQVALKLGHDLAGSSAISAKSPLAGSDFRIGDSLWRSQVIAPPTIEGGFAIALRRTVSDVIPLSKLCEGVNLRELAKGNDAGSEAVFEAFNGEDFYTFIKAAVLAKWNILFSGGTSSGKTTWLRACLEVVPKDERILTIEDVYEMRPKHPNCLSMRVSKEASSSDLLKACLRLRPDRIFMGELRGAEAFDFLSVINSGHPGAISTLHSDSPDGAMWRLANMVMQAGMAKSQENIFGECERAIHVIIQLSKIEGVRRPTAIKIFKKRG